MFKKDNMKRDRSLEKTLPFCFDTQYYLTKYPDVKLSGTNPLEHYLKYGWREGRNPSLWFDTKYYMENNPDVKEAGINPLEHYLEYGWREGRIPSHKYSLPPFKELVDVAGRDSNPLLEYLEKKDTEQWIAENVTLLPNEEKTILIISNNYGGGTETYLKNCLLNDECKEEFILCARYMHDLDYVKVDVIKNGQIIEIINYCEVSHFIYAVMNADITQIVLNSLVAWKSVKEMLDFIAAYKKLNNKCYVEVKGHDFYSICPAYTLLDNTGKYCGIRNDPNGCKECIRTHEISVFRDRETESGFSVSNWRDMWCAFYSDTADSLIVFSHSSEEIFLEAYPVLKNKILYKPHTIPEFSMCNVAIIGNLHAHKGSQIVIDLCNYLEENNADDMRLFLFGCNIYDIHSRYLKDMGPYLRGDLPNLLSENKINVVLIPSIWPETFCYTAGEALKLGYNVACFDYGGQAEQVKESEKGIILNSVNSAYIYKTLRPFGSKNSLNDCNGVKTF